MEDKIIEILSKLFAFTAIIILLCFGIKGCVDKIEEDRLTREILKEVLQERREANAVK